MLFLDYTNIKLYFFIYIEFLDTPIYIRQIYPKINFVFPYLVYKFLNGGKKKENRFNFKKYERQSRGW